MDFQSAMETFAEAWVAANSKGCPLSDMSVQSQALALTRNCKSPVGPPGLCQSRCESRGQSEATNTPAPSMSITPHVDNESLISPPSMKDGFDKATSGKSLPVHCVVESIGSLEEPRVSQSSQWRRRPIIETDSFVIIPINTPFQELVHAALHRLGYPADSASAARGSLVMKNWKPLTFDQITDDPVITVGDVLGELTTVATLKIQMYRARPSAIVDIKDKLLKLLLVQSQGRLLNSGCPLDELLLSHICRGDSSGAHAPEPSEECRRKFDQWWASQLNTQHVHSALFSMAQAQVQAQAKQNLEPRPLEHVHPAMQTVQSQYPTQKTRMRTSFDPELELPKLQRWFNENQHPSRQQIQQYVKELNSLESRRGRKPLDVNNVVYWFKNARAAQKRAEVRNMSPGIPCHLSVNGYNSGSHSPPNGAGMILNADRFNPLKSSAPVPFDRNPHMNMIPEEISMHSSLGEDESNADMGRNEIEQPMSPVGPLSLTNKRKRDDDDDDNESPVRTSSPRNHQSLLEPKIEPSDEPVNLHSPSDLSNNNKMKEHVSDPEDDVNEKESCNILEKNLNESVSNDLSNQSRLEEIARQQQLHRLCSPGSEHQENGQLIPRVPGGPENIDRLAGFPLVPNSMFSHSIMYMSHYIPGLGHGNIPNTPPPSSSGLSMSSLAASAADERRKRNRTFIDPVTEVPRLEQWFSLNTHPSHTMILKYTEELNRMQYRQKFPRLEPKNVQFWFKNRRAKCKRLKMSLYETQAPPGQYHQDRE